MKLDDARYVAAQYRDAANFDARVRIYELFDVDPERWPRWLFGRLELRAGERVLALGCGTGNLWRENADRLQATLSLTLTDLSAGMISEARERLRELSPAPEFREADAQSLPFRDAGFDVVIANHMLYHVPDRPRALGEVRRVLRPGGRFFAATYPWTHLIELRELLERFGLPGVLLPPTRDAVGFDLERAGEEIAALLRVESIQRRDSALEVTDPDVLVAYVRSAEKSPLDPTALARLRAHVAREIERAGAYHIGISAGVVTAIRP
jgi:SAM-dependent methyltransferase